MPNNSRSFTDSPFIKVLRETGQHCELRQHLIEKLGKFFGAKIVVFFTSFSKRSAQIEDNDAEMLESILSSEHSAGGKMILVINSPGGQALAAERIVNVCRAYSHGLFEVIVPHMAKSAATLICFGANVIHLSPTSELGPVDPQVPYWRDGANPEQDEPNWISAEEYIRSYDDLIRDAASGKAQRIEPYIQQLGRYDSRHIERLRSLQRLSADISVRLLKNSMMKSKSAMSIRRAIDVFLSQKRTSAHGRMITFKEAKGTGLAVKAIDLQSDTWHTLWELYVRSEWSVNHSCGKIPETSKSAVHS